MNQTLKKKKKLFLTFILRERPLSLFEVPTHLAIVTHLQHQIDVVAVFKVIVEL